MSKIKVGIVGATGYTGLELVRILLFHPGIEIQFITSETYSGKKFSDIHPHFRGTVDFDLLGKKDIQSFSPDIVFLALPHGVSMEFVQEFGLSGFKIIDLSADFRIKDQKLYEHWYNSKHTCNELLKNAVYGLPEYFAEEITKANLVANPGCYPTSVILPLAVLLKNDIIDSEHLVVDSKSGVTGAGAQAKQATHFSSVYDNFKAYGLMNHRHIPEMESILGEITEIPVKLQFIPHLLPINRGILSTIYGNPGNEFSAEKLQETLRNYFKNEPFVKIVEEPPAVNHVRGSNFCNIFTTFNERTNRIIIISVIDNLVKGASGQAVQNMNLMFGLNQTEGLLSLALVP
ncbi:N-acetyl-gamma-glutamyl-phosphate reductase [Bacteroidota bacterium]